MSDSTAQGAIRIREALKKIGYSSRAVSVKVNYFGTSSSIDVTIKKRGIDLAVVKKIADGQESIDRCKYSGDILAGGNCYVDTRYCSKLKRKIEEESNELASAGFKRVVDGQGYEIEVLGFKFVYACGASDIRIVDAPEGMFERVGAFEDAFKSAIGHLLCRVAA